MDEQKLFVDIFCRIFAELEVLAGKNCWFVQFVRVPSFSPTRKLSYSFRAARLLDKSGNAIIAVKKVLFAYMKTHRWKSGPIALSTSPFEQNWPSALDCTFTCEWGILSFPLTAFPRLTFH